MLLPHVVVFPTHTYAYLPCTCSGEVQDAYVITKEKDLPKLHRAAWKGDLAKVKQMTKNIKKSDLNSRDKEARWGMGASLSLCCCCWCVCVCVCAYMHIQYTPGLFLLAAMMAFLQDLDHSPAKIRQARLTSCYQIVCGERLR